jgi:hypothetical protein
MKCSLLDIALLTANKLNNDMIFRGFSCLAWQTQPNPKLQLHYFLISPAFAVHRQNT